MTRATRPPTPKVRLVHWHVTEAAARAEPLIAAGFEVDHRVPEGPAFTTELERSSPAVLVISLDRLPAQGRDLGVAVRVRSGTRRTRLVFAGGKPDKVERVRSVLPDAEFAEWRELVGVVRRVTEAPSGETVVPNGVFAAYAGRPLSQKLGIREGAVVSLIDAPDDIRAILGPLPAGARLEDGTGLGCDLALWFVRSSAQLAERIAAMASELDRNTVWIAWPKKGSRLETDLDQRQVRRRGLAAGLVDSKICAIDETWSALRFTRRRRTGRRV